MSCFDDILCSEDRYFGFVKNRRKISLWAKIERFKSVYRKLLSSSSIAHLSDNEETRVGPDIVQLELQ